MDINYLFYFIIFNFLFFHPTKDILEIFDKGHSLLNILLYLLQFSWLERTTFFPNFWEKQSAGPGWRKIGGN